MTRCTLGFLLVASVLQDANCFAPCQTQARVASLSPTVASLTPTTTFAGVSKPSQFALFVSEDEGASDDANEKEQKKVAGRKKRVILGYKAIAAGQLSSLFATPLPITSHALQSAQGPILAGSVAWILSGAAKADRLGSDTYKRLNLGLMLYGVISLAAMKLQSSMMVVSPWLMFVAILTTVNPIKGYGYGVLGLDKKSGSTTVIGDLQSGVQSTLKGMLPTNSVRSAMYLTATYFALATDVFVKLRIFQIARVPVSESFSGSLKAYAIARRLSALKQFSMLAMLSFTLKDAADRKRLNGTTFIQIGYLTSLCFGILAAAAFEYSRFSWFGITSGIFSFWSLYNSVSTAIAKRNNKPKSE